MSSSTSQSFPYSHSFVRQFAQSSSRPRSQSPEGSSEQSSGNLSPTSQSISLEIFDADQMIAEVPPRRHTQSLVTRRPLRSPHSSESDTTFLNEEPPLLPSSQSFDNLSYVDLDNGQRTEFEKLMKNESSWVRSCLHKGLVVNGVFFMVMVVGILLVEVLYPLEGVRGEGITIANDSRCLNKTAACITVRLVRAVGVFGFLGGVTNWIAIEMLFRSIPLLIGTGVIAKQYKEIRESICRIVVGTLFDPEALRQYFSGRNQSVREMLQLETHFGSLLSSEAANQIIERKIDVALATPEGFVLTMMGVDHGELRTVIRRHVQGFVSEISPAILDKMADTGLTDGIGLQTEVERILEERIEELSAKKVKQLVAVMIRKHLSWLIVWGNLFGALLGIIVEVLVIVATKVLIGF